MDKKGKKNTVKAGDAGAKVEETRAVPKSNAPKAGEVVDGAKKPKTLIPDIIRGRMPIAVVYLVRYGDNKGEETKDLAVLFGTTVGKISDVKKGNTFGYLTEDFRPTANQKNEGIAWLKRHVGYKDGKVDKLIDELEGMKEPTAEQAKKFEDARVAARGQKTTTKTGAVADAGGGNRRKAPEKTKKAEKVEGDKPTAKDLLK